MNKPKIIAVVGPTALGKSDFAVSLAKKINGEVISADSRQVYKGLDIGTGKITKNEMCGVPHYMLDIANPKKRISVEEYKKQATRVIEKIIKKGKTPIVCGGTGFYIDELLFPSKLPPVIANRKLRDKLSKKSADQLYKMLKLKDKKRALEMDPKNKVRLIRSLEIINKLGKVPKLEKEKPYDVYFIKLDAPIDVLRKNIKERIARRIKLGMLDEAKLLHKKGLSYKAMKSFGLEYRWMAKLLKKEIDMEQFLKGLESDIVKYARRQKTWFKRY